METADRRVSGVLRHPRFHLLEDGEVRRVHLAVGLVAERADQHAAERVQIEPRENVRMAGRKFQDRARLRRASGKVSGAILLRLGGPGVREIAIEVVEIVRQEIGAGDSPAIEIDDAPFGIEFEVGARVFGHARTHHRRVERRAVLVAELHEFAVRIRPPHVARDAVPVDVGALPVRVVLVGAVVDGAGPDVASSLQHFLGPVGRDSRDHIEKRFLDGFRHVRRERLPAHFDAAPVKGQDVVGHGQRDAGAADLRRVHVAVDPDRGSCLVGVASDDEQRDVPASGAPADRDHAGDVGILLRPRGKLIGELGVVEIFLAKHWMTSKDEPQGRHYGALTMAAAAR